MNPLDWLLDDTNRSTVFTALKWIGGLLSTAAAAVFLKAFGRIRAAILNRWLNLNEEKALGEARRYFGPRVVAVKPFRLIGSGEYWIAVLYRTRKVRRERSNITDARLAIMKGRNGNYEIIRTGVYQYVIGQYPSNFFGVADARKNGSRVVYVVSYSAGSGAASLQLSLFDAKEEKEYQVSWSYEYHVTPPEITMNGDFSERPELRSWMRNKVERLADHDRILPQSAKERAFRNAEEIWVARHGRGCTNGPIHITRIHGKPPRLSTPIYEVDDGTYVWTSFFKGCLASYDKAKDEYFVAFVPPTQYHWITQIIVGERYIWLQTHSALTKGQGILTINRATLTMRIVKVREALEMGRRRAELFLSWGLNVRRQRLFLGDVKLTLPKSVSPRTEFKCARAAAVPEEDSIEI